MDITPFGKNTHVCNMLCRPHLEWDKGRRMMNNDDVMSDRQLVNTRHNRVDRFILPREYISDMRRRSWHGSDPSTSIYNSFQNSLKKKKYTNHLKKVFSIEPKEDNDIYKKWDRPWPCVPRKKTYLSSPDNILDLPSYNFATFPELLDWSKDNVLVAALGVRYHKWSWSSQKLVNHGFTGNIIQCCKFDPRGELLLLGTHVNSVEIHNNESSKRQAIVRCQTHELLSPHNTNIHICSITAVDWSPTGNSFVMGCSWGAVTSFTRSASMLRYIRLTQDPIHLLRVSPDARFLAVSVINSRAVTLLTWPSLNRYSSLDSEWTIKTMTWHPWRSALLGLGAITPGFQALIAVWNAPTSDVCENFGPFNYSLDTMLFSERTGELVVSLWDFARPVLGPIMYSQLVVLSDPHTVVDQWGEDRNWSDRVRTMVFSPDGSKLATATSGDDLIIWNFLPEEKRDAKMKRRRFSAIPVYLDEVTKGCSFR